jgi:hypothetical protein
MMPELTEQEQVERLRDAVSAVHESVYQGIHEACLALYRKYGMSYYEASYWVWSILASEASSAREYWQVVQFGIGGPDPYLRRGGITLSAFVPKEQ